MSLVDYASSDEESGNEGEKNEKKEITQIKEKQLKANSTNVKISDNSDNNEVLFSSLPKPRKSFFLDDDNKLSKLLLNGNNGFLNKKESVKISVPSVSEFEDATKQPASKKIKPSVKGAGLFSLLPPPKNTTVKRIVKNIVPHVVPKNQVMKTSNKAETNSKFVNKSLSKDINVDDDDDDDDDDTPIGSSFFGSSLAQHKSDLNSDVISFENISSANIANNFAEPGNSFVNELLVPAKNINPSLVLNVEKNQNYSADSSQNAEVFSVSDNPLDLDEKALQILCGNKKKRQQMPMNIIELSGKEVLPDSKEWLLKQFTEEKRARSHSHKKNHGPSSQSRRKHQITYLAYQAKEQELELQNQWAANRMSRKQTQSKYGF